MRALFIVGAKLIGLLVFYWAVQHVTPIVSSVRLFWINVPDANVPTFDPIWNLVTYSLSFLVAVWFAWFLLVRGERLAALVSLPEGSSDIPPIAPETVLQIGVVVAGLLVVCHALPRFMLDAFLVLSRPSGDLSLPTYTVYGESRLAESGIELLLSWVLLFRSERVGRFLSRCSMEDRQDLPRPERQDPTKQGFH